MIALFDMISYYDVKKKKKVEKLMWTRFKRDRPIGSKYKNSWMRKGAKMQNDLIEKVEIPKDSFDIINGSVPKEPQVPEIVEMMRSQ